MEPLLESETPLLVDPEGAYRNATDLLEERLAKAPEHIAFEIPVRNEQGKIESWQPVSTADFTHRVRQIARGLIVAGVKPGDAVAILSLTRFEWALTDFACMYAGAVVVPIYDSSSAHQIEQIVQDADIRFGFGGTHELCQKLEQAISTNAQETAVWSLDSTAMSSLVQLEECGVCVSDAELENRRTLAQLDSPATMVYTSGTTGAPKGAIITHRNFIGQVLNVAASYHKVVQEDGRTVIFLPLAHVLARGLQMICLAKGMRIAHLANPGELVPQLSVVRPTFLVVVPRVLEKIREAVAGKAQRTHLGPLWDQAELIAVAQGRALEQQEGGQTVHLSVLHRAQFALFDRMFYSKIRALTGGNIGWLLSGGAALAPELSLLFRGMGLPVIEGYGLTETTAPLCGNLPGDIRAGTVGVPLPGATVRISEHGEILARGIGVFAGYRDTTLNDAAFTSDGFFRTGDLGELDQRGRLILKGRLKDEILTAGGKSITPFTWENEVEKDPWVAHAVMVGEGQKFLTALIVPDDAADEYNSEELRAHFDPIVERANALVARSEQVKKFEVVRVMPDDAALVTPTQKLKRGAFCQRFEQEINSMYGDR